MNEKNFTVGYDVRIVGRLARLVGGLIPLILILMDIAILDNPIPKVAPIILLRDTGIYLIGVAVAYAALYYTLHGHKLRFLKELEAQGEQRIEIRFVSGHGFVQTP